MNTNPKHKLIQDLGNSWYLIPETYEFDFEEWLDSEDYSSGIPPSYAHPVSNPSSVVFENPQVVN